MFLPRLIEFVSKRFETKQRHKQNRAKRANTEATKFLLVYTKSDLDIFGVNFTTEHQKKRKKTLSYQKHQSTKKHHHTLLYSIPPGAILTRKLSFANQHFWLKFQILVRNFSQNIFLAKHRNFY